MTTGPGTGREWTLRYVCAECGNTVASFPDVRTNEPNTLGLCDKQECRAAASAKWKAQV
jgi:DNA-directed RNA polymerase subunit RPC12/RpoP